MQPDVSVKDFVDAAARIPIGIRAAVMNAIHGSSDLSSLEVDPAFKAFLEQHQASNRQLIAAYLNQVWHCDTVIPVWTGPIAAANGTGSIFDAVRDVVAVAERRILLAYYAITTGTVERIGLLERNDIPRTVLCDRSQVDFEAVEFMRRNGIIVHTLGKARAHFHAKCVIADGEQIVISSANASWSAERHNIEMGVIVRGPAAAEIEALFLGLVTLLQH